MEAALADEQVAAMYRARLREGGFRIGSHIELTADESGGLKFGPCFFSERYTPEDCWFMSAFDEGFLCGIMGIEGSLCFNCRLTEGAACCRAELK